MEKNYILPLAALRGIVVMPGCTVSFDVLRDISKRAFDEASAKKGNIVLAAQKNPDKENPEFSDLYTFGTLCRIKQLMKLPNGSERVVCEGIGRVALNEMLLSEPYFTVACTAIESKEPTDAVENAGLIRALQETFEEHIKYSRNISREDVMENVAKIHTLGGLCDFIAGAASLDFPVKQEILEIYDVYERGETLISALELETEIMKVQHELMIEAHKRIEENQRDFFLREQRNIINEELGDSDEEELEEYQKKIEALEAPDEIREKLLKDLSRMSKMMGSSSDAALLRNYLDTALEVPWSHTDEENIDLDKVREVLNRDHFGLEKVKERVLEYLAVRKLTGAAEGTVICLAGPPGTGKTSIARSIADALGRKYVRVSLGGVRDEAEIRGHRRTYIGAMPGRIIDGMISAGSKNPLMLLDEVDKLSSDWKGDPTAALLEVLDSEQNKSFKDHYLDLPYDLSEVMFIATANDLSNIPAPLYDRLEIIEVGGYTNNEKFSIAKEYLLPKQLKKNGLSDKHIEVSDGALRKICDSYTREAGVRQTERMIASLLRKIAKKVADGKKSVKITEKNIAQYLGKPRYSFDMMNSEDLVGVVRGLAWTQAGGDTLSIEVNVMPGTGKLELTGQLGDVMKESAKAAISYIRSESAPLGIETDFYKTKDIHIHIPEGAVPKDGPSAGVTMATAVASALSGRAVRRDVAMTGEITLRGRVLPIGGLKEKSVAALRAGIGTVIIPAENRVDVDELPREVKDGIKFIPVKSMSEVLRHSFAGTKRGSRK